MLAHSPPLPLIINYMDKVREASVEDEEAILVALQHRDRVRRIGLWMPAPNLLNPIKAMVGQFPVLERLFIWPRVEHNMNLILPTSFQAPHLRMLGLTCVALPTRSLLLTTTVGLVSLSLWDIPFVAYFHPSYVVARLSTMPQLECLTIGFKYPIPTRDIERIPLDIGTHLTLPNVRQFFFRGMGAYLEGLLVRIRAPLLKVLQIWLFNQPTLILPHLLQFMGTAENLRFNFFQLTFYRDGVVLSADRREGDRINPFDVTIPCRHLDWQVSVAAQIFNALEPTLSIVERLALDYEKHDLSSEWHDEINRTQWRELLRPFNSVKALHVAGGIIGGLSRSLQAENGEPPLELLPELKELIYDKGDDSGDAFTPFINARQVAGRSVTLICLPPPLSLWY